MRKKALIVSSVASMIDQFNIANIEILRKMDYEVHVACNFIESGSIDSKRVAKLKEKLANDNVVCHQIDFSRNPFNLAKSLQAGKQLGIVMKNNYSLVHSHSPIGGVMARITGSKYRKHGLAAIYTAHGFHFHKSSSKLNWMIYYPIELLLSYKTDVLLTINSEDYDLAKRKFKSKKVVYIPSIGVNLDSINSQFINVIKKRNEMRVKSGAFVLVSVGELNDNKNHITIIRALSKLTNSNFCYFICGKGPLSDQLQREVEMLQLNDKVKILGYREDVIEILKMADLFVFPSKREGLGMAALEAMACGLPLLTSDVHGINDYSINGYSGFKCEPLDVDGFSNLIDRVMNLDIDKLNEMKKNNLHTIKKYDRKIVNVLMTDIYERSTVSKNETR